MLIKITEPVISNFDKLEKAISIISTFHEYHSLSDFGEDLIRDAISDNFLLKDEYLALITASINQVSFEKVIFVTVDDESQPNYVPIDKLRDVLSSKALVVVEDEHMDSHFVSLVLSVCRCRKELDLLYKSWDFAHAGGCGAIPKKINLEFDKSPYARMLVLVDSDKKHPTDELENIKNIIIQLSNEKSVPYHILEKREIENYIPVELISSLSVAFENKAKILHSLTSSQLDYIDYKIGFKKKKFDDACYNELFLDVDESVYSFDGFSDKIAAICYKENKSKFTIEGLKSRCGNIISEFEDISRKIRMIL